MVLSTLLSIEKFIMYLFICICICICIGICIGICTGICIGICIMYMYMYYILYYISINNCIYNRCMILYIVMRNFHQDTNN